MPPFSPVVTVYPAVVPRSAAVDASLAGTDPENTHPNSGLVIGRKVFTTADAPLTSQLSFLEMEMEQENDENEEVYEDALLEGLSFNEEGTCEDNTNAMESSFSLSRPDSPMEEEEEEDDQSSRWDNFPISGEASHVSSKRLVNVPGAFHLKSKRPRSSRKVSFPPAMDGDSLFSDNNNGARCLEQVRETIHVSEITAAERLATWYTSADLKSFKRERKLTARRIDDGTLSLRISTCKNDMLSDICVDFTPHGVPVSYCSRGVENCTEAISRVRYGHIADGLRAVLNTQEKHYFRRRNLISTSSTKETLKDIPSLIRARMSAIANTSGWISKTDQISNPTQCEHKCCTDELAAAYQPTSVASLEIARSRALCDERDVAVQNAFDMQHSMKASRAPLAISTPPSSPVQPFFTPTNDQEANHFFFHESPTKFSERSNLATVLPAIRVMDV